MKDFVQRYTPPSDILEQIIADEQEIIADTIGYNNRQDSIFIKDDNILRVLFASRMKNYIKQRKYQYVEVPRKYVVLIGEKLLVVAERIDGVPMNAATLNVEQIMQFADVVMAMGYKDIDACINQYANIVVYNNRFFFRDTEKVSFCHFNENEPQSRLDLLKNLAKSLTTYGEQLTEDVRAWLEEALYLENNEFASDSISTRTDLDDYALNYNEIESYYYQHGGDSNNFYD